MNIPTNKQKNIHKKIVLIYNIDAKYKLETDAKYFVKTTQ